MIIRYARPEMVALWSDENKYRIWLEIETLAAEAMAKIGRIPADVPAKIRERGGFDIARIDAIEKEVKHDVIAFLTSVTEHVGEEARFLHEGMTSSDVLDTCLAVQLTQASDLLDRALERVLAALKKRAYEHKDTLCLGRSHGIHAEPTSFGLKLAGYYAEFTRNRQRLAQARAEIATCAISGAVGTFAHVEPSVEQYVAEKLGLAVEPISTQIIPRDRHAAFFATLGVIGASIERLATEIRHLQRTELLEAEEYFAPGQKGSSAMPHKRNPVLSENLTGLARLVRASVMPALENVALWHERDISHSSVERAIAPDTTTHLHFALHRLAQIIEQWLIYPDAMLRHLQRLGGLIHSQQVLLALIDRGMDRHDAYRIVQAAAMQVWQQPNPDRDAFFQTLRANSRVKELLSKDELEALFDPRHHLKHVDGIFARVFGV